MKVALVTLIPIQDYIKIVKMSAVITQMRMKIQQLTLMMMMMMMMIWI